MSIFKKNNKESLEKEELENINEDVQEFDDIDLDSEDIIDYEEETTDNEYNEDNIIIDTNTENEIKAEDTNEVNEDKIEYVLYLVIDRQSHGLLNYFRESGINVSNIYNTIEDARNTILMQPEPCRVLIADTGLGRFTNTKTRQELIDMLGICDINNRITVFYTDSVLKADSTRELGKAKLDIDWIKYEGTASMVANTLSYKENYIMDDYIDDLDTIPEKEDIYKIKGFNTNAPYGEQIYVRGLDSTDLINNMLSSEEGLLQGYKVNMKM